MSQAAAIVPVGYHAPDEPRVHLEALSLADLAVRMRPALLNRPSRPAFHQLLLVTEGRAALTVDFTEHRLTPGTVTHVRPGQVQHLPSFARLQGIAVLFTSDFPLATPRLTPLLDGPADSRATRAAPPSVPEAFADILTEYDRRPDRGRDGGPDVELLRHLLTGLLLRLEREHPTAPQHGLFPAFQRDLEHRFATDHAVASYATRLACSPRTLTRTCLAATGVGAKDLIDARLALEAQRLLAHTQEPAAAIARTLGFTESTNFTKFFLRRTGTTPTAFRTAAGPRP